MKPTLIISIAFFLVSSFSCNKEDNPGTGRKFYPADQFVMGADLSYVNQILDVGGTYRDSGQIKDPYLIFSEYGANVVRLRLWHNPVWTSELYPGQDMGIYNGFDDVKRAIIESKKNGLKVCLDFHYSDNWADPSKQVVPAAWAGLTLELLRDSLYNYTLKTLVDLDKQGLMPEYVQVGNEINPGFLLPQGSRWNGNEDNFVYLINAAIDAVHDAGIASTVKPEVIIHVAQPENVVNWFSGLEGRGLHDFDIIGVSYYYIWSDTPLESLSDKLHEIKSTYNKKVMVVETAYPFTTNNADSYPNIIIPAKLVTPLFPASVQGQYDYLVALVQEIIDGGGSGIMYWEPAWITSGLNTQWGTGSAWDCNTLFSFGGDVIKGINFMTYEYNF